MGIALIRQKSRYLRSFSVSPNVPCADRQFATWRLPGFRQGFCQSCWKCIGAPGLLLIFKRSRTGLRSSNSSITYPPVVPSENVTIIPSAPSNSTASISVPIFIETLLHGKELACCSILLTGRSSINGFCI